MRYDAFISYSHAADDRLAPALQAALHRLARPWYRPRALHIFRDKTNLSAAPSLWPRIEAALRESRTLILLASPDAAQSKWVRREIEFWRSKDNAGPIYLVLTEGAPLVWNAEARAFIESNSVPNTLRGAYEDEPLWIDLSWARSETDLSLKNPRFAEDAATLAAELRGVEKDMIIGEDVRQHRRTRAVAGAAIVALVVLLAAATVAAVIARRQLTRARENLAGTLATNALLGADGRDTALLMAVAASKLAETPTTRAALLRMVQRNRHVVKTLYPRDRLKNVVSLAVSDRGDVAATTAGEEIYVWDSGTDRVRVVQGSDAQRVAYSQGELVAIMGRFEPELWDGKTRIPLGINCSFNPSLDAQLVGAPGSDVIAFFSDDCGKSDSSALGVCRRSPRLACRTVALPEVPRGIALTDNGQLLGVAFTAAVHLFRSADLGKERVAQTTGEIVTIAGGDGAFHVLLSDGDEEKIALDQNASGSEAAAVSVPPPRFAEQLSIGTSSGLRWIATTDHIGGTGTRDVDPAITLLGRSKPNGRLARQGGVNVIRPPEGFVVRDGELFERDSLGREARRSVSPEELPPWRDSDDHQVEVFAVSSDGATIATAANLRTEGFSPRVVVRNGTDTPLLLPSNTANKILAVGAHFVVGAGEGKLQLWDRRTGAVASDPFIAPREVTDLAFAENDAALMIVYYDTAAETIELSLQPLQRLACEMANRDLSPEEWRVRLPALPYEPICSNLLGRTLSKRW